MAERRVDGDDVLHLDALEKAEGVHRDSRVPLRSVVAVRAVDDAWAELRGLRAPGTGLRPGPTPRSPRSPRSKAGRTTGSAPRRAG